MDFPKKPCRLFSVSALGLLGLSLFFNSCGSYRDIQSDNGKQAVIEEANLYLNSGNCDKAIETLTPLYQSSRTDNEVRMVFSSAYACKAGFSMTRIITNLKGSGNIWNIIVSSLYSNGSDGHYANFMEAATILRTTAPNGSLFAVDRPGDANVYMIFMQLGVISSLISRMGVADSGTGAQTTPLVASDATMAERCSIQVAFSTINDSLDSLGADTGTLANLSTVVAAVCALGGCTNVDPAVCTAAEDTIGTGFIAAIDASW